MEFGVRDWMIIVGVLLILAVLLDGFRRMRQERRGKIRMSLNKQFINAGDPEEDLPLSSELPNGGARVVGRNARDDDGRLDLEQSVPMLMDVDDQQLSADLFDYEVESFSALDDGDNSDAGDDEQESLSPKSEPELSSEDAKEEQSYVLSNAGAYTDQKKSKRAAPQSHATQDKAASKPAVEPEEVLIINVAAKGAPFKGPDLLHILLACDLRFGDMNIFHRYEKSGGKGAVQFSMANSVEPGTFDLEKIDDFTTPGVCFFMSVPGPEQPIKAFECMVETAQCLVTNLNGELLDDSRSAMTNQTLEHCRQRLQEFERRQLTHV